jgi:hypothetical protein
LSVPISFRFVSCSKTDIRVSLACDDVLKGKWFPSSYGPSLYGKYEMKLTLTSLLQLDEDSNSFHELYMRIATLFISYQVSYKYFWLKF